MTNRQSRSDAKGIDGTNSDQDLNIGLMIKAIFLGVSVDLGGPLLAVLIALLGYKILMAPAGTSLRQISDYLEAQQTFSFKLVLDALSVIFAVLSGYICSRVAKKAEMRLATVMVVIEIVWDCCTADQHDSATRTIVLAALSCCGILIGANLGRQFNQLVVSSVSESAGTVGRSQRADGVSNSDRFQRRALAYAVPSFIVIALAELHHLGVSVSEVFRVLLSRSSSDVLLLAIAIPVLIRAKRRQKVQKQSGLSPNEFLLKEVGGPEKLREQARTVKALGWLMIVIFGLPVFAAFDKGKLDFALKVSIPIAAIGCIVAWYFFSRSAKLLSIADSAESNVFEATQPQV